MTTIKLNRYYPHMTENITLEVSDEIAVVLSAGGRQCDSYKRRKREHNECSLDADPGFEPDVMFPPLTPEEIILDEENRSVLYAALDQLPPIQARRVYAHYILGKK
ncbi:sigma-70 family RNA polymerase sigma factor, partial [Pseudoflavonifractor sp. 60]